MLILEEQVKPKETRSINTVTYVRCNCIHDPNISDFV